MHAANSCATGMVAFVTACRIIDTKEATEGFASSGLLTVVILFVVSVGGCTSGQTLVKCLPLAL
jgi:hypothetical protein